MLRGVKFCLVAVTAVLSALALAPMTAAASDGHDPFAGKPSPQSGWRRNRMSLGHRAEPRPVPQIEVIPQRDSVARQCRRWKALATQLGETYAGHRLRETVLQRVCGMTEDDFDDQIWGWPWVSLDEGAMVPPRLYRAHGAWEIRCDAAGDRRRCALLHRLAVPTTVPVEAAAHVASQDVIVHFVIDMVAGRETVLWRLFVPGAGGNPQPKPEMIAFGVNRALEQRQARGHVRYRLGATEYTEGFPACGVQGCIMEAHVQRAGAVASRLWDGKALDVEVRIGRDAAAKTFALSIPPRGFRAAFGELIKLRRDETRGLARR